MTPNATQVFSIPHSRSSVCKAQREARAARAAQLLFCAPMESEMLLQMGTACCSMNMIVHVKSCCAPCFWCASLPSPHLPPSVLCAVRFALLCCALCAVHFVLCALHCALCAWCFVLCAVCFALCTAPHVLRFERRALCFAALVLFACKKKSCDWIEEERDGFCKGKGWCPTFPFRVYLSRVYEGERRKHNGRSRRRLSPECF